jgi:hypothetical protein
VPSDALVRKVADQVRSTWTAAGVQVSAQDAAEGWAYGAINDCEQAGLVVFDPRTITSQETVVNVLDTHQYIAPGICKCGFRSESWAATRTHRADSILEALRHA